MPASAMNASQESTGSQIGVPFETGLWTIDDVARYARCSIRHVTHLRNHGLPFRKLGRLVRFSPEAVKRWFED